MSVVYWYSRNKWCKNYNDSILATPRPIEVVQPCNPSPCGRNAECTERGQAASCRCILDYIGNPYIECKPECTVNSECPNDKACVNKKCKDPCPGVCGIHASCHVTNHIPQCACDPGYSGNAFVACTRVTTCKFIHNLHLSLYWHEYVELEHKNLIFKRVS